MKNYSLALATLVTCLGFVAGISRAGEFEDVERNFRSQLDARTDDQLADMSQQALDEQILVLSAPRSAAEARVARRLNESAPAAVDPVTASSALAAMVARDPNHSRVARKTP